MDWERITSELNKTLDPKYVKTRKGSGRVLSYVQGWHVIAEANRIFGFNGWNRETVLLQETNRDLVTLKGKDDSTYQQWRIGYIAKVRVTVDGVIREGTGYGTGMGKPEALGDAVEGAIKEAETDAMKRALMTFGNVMGLALYDKQQENVAVPEKSEEEKKAEMRQKSEAFVDRFESAMAEFQSLDVYQAHIDNHKPWIEGIKKNFPDLDAKVQRAIDVNYERLV